MSAAHLLSYYERILPIAILVDALLTLTVIRWWRRRKDTP